MATKEKKAKVKIPPTLAKCADRLYTVKGERLAGQRALEPLKVEETVLKEHLINNLPKSDASGIAGKLCRVTISLTSEPIVESWDKLYAYILKTKDFSLLGRTVSKEAIMERWENGVKVPGVGKFNVKHVNMNKV